MFSLFAPRAKRETLLQGHSVLLRLLADSSFLSAASEEEVVAHLRWSSRFTMLMALGAGEGRGDLPKRDQLQIYDTYLAVSSRALALGALPAVASMLAATGELANIDAELGVYVVFVTRLLAGVSKPSEDEAEHPSMALSVDRLEAAAQSGVLEQLMRSLLLSGPHVWELQQQQEQQQQQQQQGGSGTGIKPRCSCHVLNMLTVFHRLLSAIEHAGLFGGRAEDLEEEGEGSSSSSSGEDDKDGGGDSDEDKDEDEEAAMLRRGAAAARSILSGRCLQYGAAAHVVAQLAAADGGTRYGLTEATCLPPLFEDAKGDTDADAASSASASTSGPTGRRVGGNRKDGGKAGGGKPRQELQHMGIAAAMRMWCNGLRGRPPMPLVGLPRAAVYALSMRTMRLAMAAAGEHAARRRRRLAEAAEATAAQSAQPPAGAERGAASSQRDARQRRQAKRAGAARRGGGAAAASATAASALPASAALPAASGGKGAPPVSANERRLLAMAPATPLSFLLPEDACARIAMEALRCSAVAARHPPNLIGGSRRRRRGADSSGDDGEGGGDGARERLSEWWRTAVPAMHLVLTHYEAGRDGSPCKSYLALREFGPSVPDWTARGLPSAPPANLSAALDTGYLALLERAMRSDARRCAARRSSPDYLLQSLTDPHLVFWLLAFGDPHAAAALMATGAKVATQAAEHCLEVGRKRHLARVGRGSDVSDSSGGSGSEGRGAVGCRMVRCTRELHELPPQPLLGVLAACAASRRRQQQRQQRLQQQADGGPGSTAAAPPSAAQGVDGEALSAAAARSTREDASHGEGDAVAVPDSVDDDAGPLPDWDPERSRQLLLLTAHTLRLWLPRLARIAGECLRREGNLLASARALAPFMLELSAWVPPLAHACALQAAAEKAEEAGQGGDACEQPGDASAGGQPVGAAVGSSGAADAGKPAAAADAAVADASSSAEAPTTAAGGTAAAAAASASAQPSSSPSPSSPSTSACWQRQLLDELGLLQLLPRAVHLLLMLEEGDSDPEIDFSMDAYEQAALDFSLSALEALAAVWPERVAAALAATGGGGNGGSDGDGGGGGGDEEEDGGSSSSGSEPYLQGLTLERLCREELQLPESLMQQRRRLVARLAALSAGAEGRAEVAGEGLAAKRRELGAVKGAFPDTPCMARDDGVPLASSREVGALLSSLPASELTGLLRSCAHPGCTNLSGDSEAELPLRACGGCGRVWYCGADCQRAHWRAGHKAACAGRRGPG